MDKTKFTINPHLDSEGFVIGLSAGDSVTVTVTKGDVLRAHADEHGLTVIDLELANAHLDGINPRGWNEPGMAKITWAEIEPADEGRSVPDYSDVLARFPEVTLTRGERHE